MPETFEIRLGHKTGHVVVGLVQGRYQATLYWFPDQRILRAPGGDGAPGVIQQHHEYGASQDEALHGLRLWALEQFSSVGNFCEGREQ